MLYKGHSSFYLLLEPNDFINWLSLGSSRHRMADILLTEIKVTFFLISGIALGSIHLSHE
jgi:hypothetical protein